MGGWLFCILWSLVNNEGSNLGISEFLKRVGLKLFFLVTVFWFYLIVDVVIVVIIVVVVDLHIFVDNVVVVERSKFNSSFCVSEKNLTKTKTTMTQKKEKRTFLEIEINGIIFFFLRQRIQANSRKRHSKKRTGSFESENERKILSEDLKTWPKPVFSLLWNLEYLFDDTR